MADVQPLKATFFTFRRRERGLLLPATITFAVLMIFSLIAFAVIVALLLGVDPNTMFSPKAGLQVASEIQNEPQRILGVFGAGFVFMVVFFVLLAAFEAGCLRWLIRGERGGLFGMSLDADTWRVYGTYWLWVVFALVSYILIVVTAAVLGFIAAMVGKATPGLEWVWMTFVFLVVISLPIILLVRTAPAAAVSVGTKRFAFFDSWKVSKGRFWALFGSFFLLIILRFLASIVISGALMGTMFAGVLQAMVSGWNNPLQMQQGIEAAMSNVYSSPGMLALYIGVQILSLVVGVVFQLLVFGVNSRAVIAAAEDGKIEGLVTVETAKAFE